MSQEDQVLAMFDEIKRKFGRIDICINNAGIIEYAPLMSGNVSDWKRVMEVCFYVGSLSSWVYFLKVISFIRLGIY